MDFTITGYGLINLNYLSRYPVNLSNFVDIFKYYFLYFESSSLRLSEQP